MKVKGCYFLVEIPIYSKDILFVFGYSLPKIASLLEHADGSDIQEFRQLCNEDYGHYKGITFVGKAGTVLIHMPDLPRTCEAHGTLYHEIFHAVEGIMEGIGNPLVEGNSESWAYLIGYITTKVLFNLSRYYP